MMLSRIHTMVTALTASNRTSDKIQTLRRFPDLREFIQMIWDPLATTGVTRKSIERSLHTKCPSSFSILDPNDILDLLRGLYSRRLTGKTAQYAIITIIRLHPEYTDLILRIVDKNLKTRMTHKIVNRAFPGLIPDFSVSLGTEKAKADAYFTQDPTSWYISRKFDGVRYIVRVDGVHTACFSRNGQNLPAMYDLAHLAGCLFPSGTILDGEICAVDDNNLECFTTAVSLAKRKLDVFKDFRFYIFDYLTHEEFDTHASTRILMDRYSALDAVRHTDDRIHVVQQTQYTDTAFGDMKTLVSNHGWEGLILRRNVPYKGRRSNDVLKHKRFFTGDYIVTGVKNGTMRIIDDQTGLEVEEEMLTAVTILHRGETVHVGSGFDHQHRRSYYRHPETIIGQLIEVQYFEECQDATGKLSLRFPTLKQVYSKKRKL
jgi:DNA ligase-1